MRAEAAPAQTLARLNDLRMAAQRENNEGRHSRARRQFSRLLRRIADTASASPDPEVSTPMHSPAAEDLRELTVRTWIGLSFACVAGARWDEAMSALVAELRLFKAIEGDGEPAYSGTLRIPGYGAWPVSCTPG